MGTIPAPLLAGITGALVFVPKKVSLQPKILFKKTVGITAVLPTAGLKGGNLKKPDLLFSHLQSAG